MKKINIRELSTILAALRHYQSMMLGESLPMGLLQIATNMGEIDPLSEMEVNRLCEELNTEIAEVDEEEAQEIPPNATDPETLDNSIEPITCDFDEAEEHFETVWNALEAWAESCVGEDTPENEEERDGVNLAMARIREIMGLPSEVERETA